ncbi:hypothetical protein [Kitasatospora sp. MBT63]|uniref:hypothetical protein n=1 Tax=Kitasatospora sp. MBT63 TaxID=1444768 RepID=UPI00053BBC20|nr:hypothetical protein [Kitasatospora sp. MBT63]
MTPRTTQEFFDRLVALVAADLPELGTEGAATILRSMDHRTRRFLREHLEVFPQALTSGSAHATPCVQRFITVLREAGYTRVKQPACPRCGLLRPLVENASPGIGHLCRNCFYLSKTGSCRRCGKTRPLVSQGHCSACYRLHVGPKKVCAACGRLTVCSAGTGRLLCDSCRPRRPKPCTLCAKSAVAYAHWPLGPVCGMCYDRNRQHPGTCTRCGQRRVLIARLDGQPACGPCAGSTTDYLCTHCGNPSDSSFRPTLCARCALKVEVADYFEGLPPAAARQLNPLREAFSRTDQPQTVASWLRNAKGARFLRDLARAGREVTHQRLDAFTAEHPMAGGHLRKLLVAVGVLAARDEHLAQVERHLERVIARHPQFSAVLRAYGRWSVLPRLRRRAQRRPPTSYVTSWATTRINRGVQFLTWAANQQVELAQVTQEQVDQWLTEGSRARYQLRDFLVWTARRGLSRDLLVPHLSKPDPAGMDEDDHWDMLQQCLHDDELPLDVRVAGALVLLYGQQVSRIVRLTAADLSRTGEQTFLTLEQAPVLLPADLAVLVTELSDRPDNAAVRGSGATRWLFPSNRHPNGHWQPATITKRLNQAGIQVKPGRATALTNLGQDLPPAVLASLTGMHIVTAEKWYRRAAPDWAVYIQSRRNS